MKSLTIEEIKTKLSVLSAASQQLAIKLFERKMNASPIVVGSFKTRTGWWGSRLEEALRAVFHLAEAMAKRMNINISDVNLSDFIGEDISYYKNLPSIHFILDPKGEQNTLKWTIQTCKTIRNLMASIAMDLSRNSEKRIYLEEWIAYPPLCHVSIKRTDPVLDDRIHPGIAIRKGIDYIRYTGFRQFRMERTVEFALHSLLGLRPGEEMNPDNFKLYEFNIDPSSGKFLSKADEIDFLRKVYHKQKITQHYYQGLRPFLTVIIPAAKEILEPWFVKRIKKDGASLSDPVLPDYLSTREGQYYKSHKADLASAMGNFIKLVET